MAAAEVLLGLGADEEHAVVAVQEALVDQVLQERGSRPVEGREAVPPVRPEPVTDAVFLQGEREQLLGDEVSGRWWRGDGLDPAPGPEGEQPGGLQQRLGARGEEETVAGGVGATAGAADPLQERGDAAGGVDLDDSVEVADVDAEFQGGGGHDDAVARLGERLLGAGPFIGGE